LRVTALLCDSAEEVGGKLYILGAGWSLIRVPNVPLNMALAILVAVEWSQANERFTLEAALVDDDGQPVNLGDQDVKASGQLEAGRPAGLKPGIDLNLPLAMQFNGISLPPGGYRWEVSIDGTQMTTIPFRVLSNQ
jgi:hypothetical protein